MTCFATRSVGWQTEVIINKTDIINGKGMPLLRVIRKIRTKLSGQSMPTSDYEYHLDVTFNHLVQGWAYNKRNPTKAVHVAFKKGNHTFCEVMADQGREDLAQAGLASAECAFEVAPDLEQNTLTPTLADMYFDGIKVNREPVVFAMDYQRLLDQLAQHSGQS